MRRGVVEGVITLARARKAYGVVIDTETLEVLQVEARALREYT